MNTEEFISRVQERTGVDSAEAAGTIIEATLETLGERTHQTERGKIVAQLPAELQEPLGRRPDTVDFDLEEFVNRVSARSNIGYPDTVKQIKAVVAVLDEALSPGELRKLLQALPHEFQELFEEEPENPLSPVREDEPSKGELYQ
jgi:uncharacterized protein (DUF2267 family)